MNAVKVFFQILLMIASVFLMFYGAINNKSTCVRRPPTLIGDLDAAWNGCHRTSLHKEKK